MTLAQPSALPAPLLAAVARSVTFAAGWRRVAVAVAAGAGSVLALAPFDLWPVGFLTFPFLVWLLDGAKGGRLEGLAAAGSAGWWFGFGYFLAGLYWIGNAVLVDAPTFGWLLPFAVLLPPAGLALFTALGVVLARLMWVPGPTRVLALAVGLTVAEWLRGWVLTGFPWNAFGYMLTGPMVMAQSAAVLGLWGLTFVAVAAFASPAVLADDPAATRRPWLPATLSLLVLAAFAAFGAARLAANPTSFVAGVQLRIMQPNLPQDVKFNYSAKQQVLDRYIRLSRGSTEPEPETLAGITHLVWPESAFPFFLSREPEALAQIAAMLPGGTTLITGAVRASETPGSVLRAYNSVYVIDGSGNVVAVYDKTHLVPFGEYLPFQSWLESFGLMQLTKVQGGFLAGNRRLAIELSDASRMLPLVCYEIIFPAGLFPAGERPDWLVNVTNDGWFGASSGPYQHFQQARLRAIEQGLPIVRAANTGISAVIDPLGRVVRSLPLGSEGILDAGLPHALASTPYTRTGEGPVGLLLGAALVTVLLRKFRTRPSRHSRGGSGQA